MLGAIRGVPRLIGICFLVLCGACSQDPQFIEKDVSLGEGADLLPDGCEDRSKIDIQWFETNCLLAAAQLAVEPATANVVIGSHQQFSAVLITKDGQKIEVTDAARWSLVGDGTVAKVGEAGKIMGVSQGLVKILATLGNTEATANLQVRERDESVDPHLWLRVENHVVHNLSLPFGQDMHVDWGSRGIEDCRLTYGSKDYDRRLSGSTSIKALASGVVHLSCRSLRGLDLKESVTITVTRPEVVIKVNSQTDDLVLNGTQFVNVSWTSTNASSCELLRPVQRQTVNPTGALLVDVSKSQLLEVICRDAAGNAARDDIYIRMVYQTSLRLAPGVYDKIPGTAIHRPVSIMFALDVTGSMSGQIETVKSGVQDFADELVRRGFSPRMGVVPFRDKVPHSADYGDVPEGMLTLTDKIDDVKAFVSRLRARGGGNANEASLAAIKAAVTELRKGDERPDAIKIVMIVTDQPGHSAGNLSDCSLVSTINDLAALSPSEQRDFKLFFATPTTGLACSGFSHATQQMTALISQVFLAESDTAKRGGQIPWPFSHINLVSDVVDLLEVVNPDIELACLNIQTAVTLPSGERLIDEVREYAETLRLLEAGQLQTLAKSLTEDQYARMIDGGGQMVVTRCCFSRSAALAGRFDRCLLAPVETAIKFEVE
jgi:hypothetical protein